MAFMLEEVVPWGRSFDEYVEMFGLTDADLAGKRVLGCADGPASFNAEATRRGHFVVSCDPAYRYSAVDLAQRIESTRKVVMAQMLANIDAYAWDDIPSPAALEQRRMAAMTDFLADYEAGRRSGRYVTAALCSLPFADRQFDLALCSHFLFLYTGHLSFDFHLAAVRELLRLADEVRIFPLVTLDGRPSPHLDKIVERLTADGHQAEIVPVTYRFQKGANALLRVIAAGADTATRPEPTGEPP